MKVSVNVLLTHEEVLEEELATHEVGPEHYVYPAKTDVDRWVGQTNNNLIQAF